MKETYEILRGNVPELRRQVAKLNKRAKRLGLSPLALTVEGTRGAVEETSTPLKGFSLETQKQIAVVTLEGEAPKLEGWRFVATLDHHVKGNIIRRSPMENEEVPERYQIAFRQCDHCHKTRTRTDTYIVAHEDGRWAQVGRSCLRDFIGYRDPHAVARWLATLQSVLDFDYEASGGDERARQDTSVDLHGYLSMSAACIREFGWMPRARADERHVATSLHIDDFEEYLRGKGAHRARDRWLIAKYGELEITEADERLAYEAIAWIIELPQEGNSGYLWGLKIIADDGWVEQRSRGLAASLIPAYQRAQDRALEVRRENEGRVSEWVGTVGERLELSLTVKALKTMPANDFGESLLITFLDPEGRTVKWFATAAWAYELEPDNPIKVRARVKKHDEYRGLKQTIITRATRIEGN